MAFWDWHTSLNDRLSILRDGAVVATVVSENDWIGNREVDLADFIVDACNAAEKKK